MGSSPYVELRNIKKSFGATPVLESFDLAVAQGEFLSLLGPSGCGKTTTLNIVAGFLRPDEGDVQLAGASITHLPPHRRNLGMVFQRYTLFPHMNVFDNIAFGLRLRKVSHDQIARKVDDALRLVRLPDVAQRFRGQLSGGQQQRIALARALVLEPKVLLLDEPLSNLDAKLRRELQVELRRIHEELGITSIYVTHDQEEALVLSDRIAVMNRGRVEQIGTPQAIYQRPRTRFVADFIGESNFLRGRVLGRSSTELRLELPGGCQLTAVLQDDAPLQDTGTAVELAIREEKVRLSAEATGSNCLSARLARIVYHGAWSRHFFEANGLEIRANRIPADQRHEVGETVNLRLPPDDLIVLASATHGSGKREV